MDCSHSRKHVLLALSIIAASALVTSCKANSPALSPGPGSVALGHNHGEESSDDRSRRIHIVDKCDPATFNAALNNPNACVGNGHVTFDEFIAELTANQRVEEWHFSPDEIKSEKTVTLVLQNRGGETHTFTEVEDFGGGFVAFLNGLAGNLTPRKECAQILDDGSLAPQPPGPDNIFVSAGTTVQGPLIEAGVAEKYQCCIHPWMHLTINAPKH